jgi:hypothetical protein
MLIVVCVARVRVQYSLSSAALFALGVAFTMAGELCWLVSLLRLLTISVQACTSGATRR